MFDSIEVSKALEVRIDLPDSEEGRSDAYEELVANSVELCYVKDFGKNHEPSDPRLSQTVPALKSLSKHAYQTAKSCSTALLDMDSFIQSPDCVSQTSPPRLMC